MFEVTQAAHEQLERQFENQDITPIRVYMAAGCGGPRLALALDKQKETDNVYTSGEFTFVVDKALMTTAAPIKLEFDQHYGFSLNSSMKMNASSSCGGCCGSCS